MVEAEIRRSGYPLPPELVLAVMARESRGNPGVINPSSGASGLMQVMPIALKDYNRHNSPTISMDYMQLKNDGGARAQIRVGLWILARFWRGAYRYLKKKLGEVPLDDLAKTADFFYASGPANAKKKLDRVPRPTFEAVKARFPDSHRIAPAQRVWDSVRKMGGQWDLAAIDQWLEGGVIQQQQKTLFGAAAGLALIAVAWWYFARKDKA
jgi:hypothetical protein